MLKIAAFILASSVVLGPCSKETTTEVAPPKAMTASAPSAEAVQDTPQGVASSRSTPGGGITPVGHPGCKAATVCSCEGLDACAMACSGGGCTFRCAGAGSCKFSCLDGGCTLNSPGAGSSTLACPGGNCTVNCTGAGSCSVSGKNSKCNKVGPGECTST